MSKIQQTQQAHAQTAAKANKPQQQQHHSLSSAQMLESPEAMRSEDVLAAQQTVGNQVVQRALDKDDRRKGLTDEQGNLRQEITSQIQQKRGGGNPLPENIQKEASKKLGRNFKDVRIHTDETADTLSRTISARAFTIGKDIFFKNGVFAPGSGAGRETLMHELTHVVQQGGKGGASGALKLGGPDTAHEKEADRIGKKHATSVGAAPAGAVQREGEEDELQMQGENNIIDDTGISDNIIDDFNNKIDNNIDDEVMNQEDKLQMQGEEDELQMQGEEDELQMQEDEEELQMQEDEEELQMQPAEEDELQMQPDSGNTIQRKWELGEDKTWKKVVNEPKKKKTPQQQVIEKNETMNRAGAMLGADSPLEMAKSDKEKIGARKTQARKFDVNEELLSSTPKLKKVGFEEIEKRQQQNLESEKKAKQEQTQKTKEENAKFEKTIPGQRLKLMNTLKDPKASKAEIEAAEEKLKNLHEGAFSKEQIAEAKAARKAAIKDAALRGDEDAYKNMKTESAAEEAEKAAKKKNSKGAKAKGALGSAAKSVGGFLKRRLGALDEHVFGKEEEKEDKDAKSGGGAGGTSEMIAELYQENKKLKAQITELEKAKV